MQQSVNTIMEWFATRTSTGQRFELANVPGVTFNYREYREPLVGHD